MNSFNRFIEKNRSRSQVNESVNSEFIIKGYPTVNIVSGDSTKTACVVNKQESEVAYVYVKKDDSLSIGQVWLAKELPLLIAEEIVIIKNVGWRKYKSFICNIQCDDLYGWYRGPEKTHISISQHNDFMLTSNIKPVLVLPIGHLQIDDKVCIKGRAFLVQESDEISSNGLGYYSLVATTISKTEFAKHEGKEFFIVKKEPKDIFFPKQTEEPDENIAIPNQPITLNTEQGFFKTSLGALKVLSLKAEEVTFTIPFGVGDFTVSVLRNGAQQTITYKVAK